MSDLSFSANNLTCIRGRQRLFQNLSFRLEPGQSLYIQGENGSGKTSLLRLLAGLLEPEAGEVSWCGENISRASQRFRSQILFLGYQNNLNPVLSPIANIKLAWGIEHSQILSDIQIISALADLGLTNLSTLPFRPCYTLSAGQCRRIALTRLILSPAKLWLLDEPFTALDDKGIHLVQALMQAHLDKNGMIVYSSHLRVEDHKIIEGQHVCQL